MSKIVLFQAIQFSISTQFSSIWPIDRIQSGATTRDQSEPWSDDCKGVFHIPQSSSITGISPSESLMSYPGHSLEEGLSPPQRCVKINLCIVTYNKLLNERRYFHFLLENIPLTMEIFPITLITLSPHMSVKSFAIFW